MPDRESLNVWCNERLVGHLWRDQGKMGFRYAEAWLAQTASAKNSFAISQTMPLEEGEFAPDVADAFFANLLPEGAYRARVVYDLKIPDTDFDLLRAIGGECAGAISILEEGQQPASVYKYHPLSEDEFKNLVLDQGQTYTPSGETRLRLSMAGAQQKCPIFYEEGAFWLPEGEAPTSHLLKFEILHFRNVPAYETFTSLLARAVGLPVVDVELRTVADSEYMLIKRYDRYRDVNEQLARLHQEDFCQALGFDHASKYQEGGGPSFADCYQLVQRTSSDPETDLQHLLNWQIFNVLAGNSDGHAKNLSLLHGSGSEVRLAPFYDMVCTRAIEGVDHRLALYIGDERAPGQVTMKHWGDLAQQCDLRSDHVEREVRTLASKLLEQLQPTRQKFEQMYGDNAALQRVEQVVMKQCQRVLGKLWSASEGNGDD